MPIVKLDTFRFELKAAVTVRPSVLVIFAALMVFVTVPGVDEVT